MILRSANNYDRKAASIESGLEMLPGEGRTIQSQKDSTDINIIVKSYSQGGMIPQARIPPTYGDFMGVSDYREALDLIEEANASFAGLDAKVRARFRNDPALMLEFVANKANLEEARSLGLVEPLEVPPAAATSSTVPT